MEISSERESTSPHSSSSRSSSCSSNGVQSQPPLTPTSRGRSQTGTDPTTFIQADPSSFKQLVQMLTGSPGSNPQCKSAIRPIKTGPKKQVHKLYERRNSFKNFKVSPIISGLVQNYGLSPRELEMLSPSMLNFPSLMISPVTPLSPDPFNNSPITYATSKLSAVDQGRNTDMGSYINLSPVTTPRDSEPRLLPLFPLTSPKVASTSS